MSIAALALYHQGLVRLSQQPTALKNALFQQAGQKHSSCFIIATTASTQRNMRKAPRHSNNSLDTRAPPLCNGLLVSEVCSNVILHDQRRRNLRISQDGRNPDAASHVVLYRSTTRGVACFVASCRVLESFEILMMYTRFYSFFTHQCTSLRRAQLYFLSRLVD